MRFFAIFHTANRLRATVYQGSSILKIAATRKPTDNSPKLFVNYNHTKAFSSLKKVHKEVLPRRSYQTIENMANSTSKTYLDQLKYVIPIFLLASIIMQNIIHTEEPKREEEFSYNEDFNKLFNLLHCGETKEVFVKLIQIAKEYPELLEALLDIESGRFDEGIEKLEKVLIKQFKSKSPISVLKGLLYLCTDSEEKALSCFEQVIQNTDSVYFKSIALLHKAQILKAQQKLLQADEAEKLAYQYYNSNRILCDYQGIKNFIQSYYDEYKFLSSLKKEDRDILLKNRVVIRVWYPSKDYVQNSPISVGHASLEAQSYISFWPIKSVNSESIMSNSSASRGGYFNSFCDDILAEYIPPDVRKALYTLDSIAIESAFIDFKEKDITWALYASTFLFKNSDIANCSSMVHDLLYVAGIEKLITFYFINKFKFAHRGLIGEWVEKHFGRNSLSVVKGISILSSLYLTVAYNYYLLFPIAILPVAYSFPAAYSIGAGILFGHVIDVTDATHLIVTPSGIAWLANSAFKSEQLLFKDNPAYFINVTRNIHGFFPSKSRDTIEVVSEAKSVAQVRK